MTKKDILWILGIIAAFLISSLRECLDNPTLVETKVEVKTDTVVVPQIITKYVYKPVKPTKDTVYVEHVIEKKIIDENGGMTTVVYDTVQTPTVVNAYEDVLETDSTYLRYKIRVNGELIDFSAIHGIKYDYAKALTTGVFDQGVKKGKQSSFLMFGVSGSKKDQFIKAQYGRKRIYFEAGFSPFTRNVSVGSGIYFRL